MTCIIGLKYEGEVFLCGDRMGSAGNRLSRRINPKVFEKDGMVIGYTSSFRMGDIIRHLFKVPKHDEVESGSEYAYMVKKFVPGLITCFKTNNWLKKENEIISGGTFIVGFNSKMFTVENDFQVEEVKDKYTAVGCGDDLAKGSLHSSITDDNYDSANDVLVTAMEAAEYHSAWVGGGYDIVTTGNQD